MLTISPSALMVSHRGQAGGAGLSPRLWDKMYNQMLSPDGNSGGFFVCDDFLSVANLVASGDTIFTIGQAGLYENMADSGCTIAQLATASGGVLALSLDGSGENDEAWISYGGATSVLGAISDTAGSDKLTIFEARFSLSQVTSGGVFVGLAEENLAAADTMVDTTTAMAAKDHIGFHVDHDDPDALLFSYAKGAGAVQQPITKFYDEDGTAVTLALNTYYKVGFVYDPKAPADSRIKVFLNNVEQPTKITAADIAHADSLFPDGEEMTFLAGLKSPTEAAKVLNLDWWAYYQAR